jgi:hypothetical protein
LPPRDEPAVPARAAAPPAFEGEILLPGDPDVGPTAIERAYGHKLGMTDAEIGAEFEKLVQHRVDKPGYPTWRWFNRYAEYRRQHPVKRTIIDAANDLAAAIDAQIAAGGGAVFGEAPVRAMPIVVVRGTDEWPRRVQAGHPDSLHKMVHADDGRIAEGWYFQPAPAGRSAA